MELKRRTAPLRLVAMRLNMPELEKVARQPGIVEAFRLTIQYHDGRHPDQIATLTRLQSGLSAHLEVHYRRANDQTLVLAHTVEVDRFQGLLTALRKLDFDRLDDPADMPWHGADLWLVERGAGTFHHDFMLAPDSATGVHAEVVRLIREKLREAVRAINP